MSRLINSLSSARRMAQTSLVLQKKGWGWLRGHRPELPQLMRETMEDLGSTYIKLGQLIASSPSLFPHEYVEAFQGCLDQTSPVPYSTIENILNAEFGSRLSQIFDHIDPKPLASASIAQVHAATLRSGESVVIKVQKPGVKDVLSTDFNFLFFSAKVFEKVSPKAWDSALSDIVDEIRLGMLEECDFHKEVENIALYREFLQGAGITDVVVPHVYSEACTGRVITMERFYGCSLSDIDAVNRIVKDPSEPVVAALNAWFSSLMQCQIYHADLHAGNVILLNDGRIGFIDFGIVGHIKQQTWSGLMTLMVALPAQDFMQIAQALCDIGATGVEVDVRRFADDLELLFNDITGSDADFAYNDGDDFLRQFTLRVSSLTRNYGVRFPREFTLLIKQFLYFDRYIRMLAPDVDIFDHQRMSILDLTA